MSFPYEAGGFEQVVAAPPESPHDGEALQRLASMNVVLLGIPGAGKTTLVGELQAANPDITYISVGQISRDLPPDSDERRELDRLFEVGAPVGETSFFLGLIEPHVDAAKADGRGGFILDGIPKKGEEVGPLISWLSEKGTPIDLVVSCELPALTAHDRLTERPARQGDRDTMQVFTNRVSTYLGSLSLFKEQLSHGHEIPLIVLDTESLAPAQAMQELLRQVAALPSSDPAAGERFLENEVLKNRLLEYVRTGNKRELTALYGDHFDDYLPDFDHAALADPELAREEALRMVANALAEADPSLRDLPLFLRRFAANYLDTTFMSFGHLSESLLEETVARFGEHYTADQLFEVFEQQRSLKKLMEEMQEDVIGGRDLFEVLEQELHVNGPELAHIQKVLVGRAEELGIDPSAANVRMLMGLQAALWGQFTSNQILLAPDLNYRRTVNGQPGAHHSLLPFTKNPRSFVANSMGNYVPFIEAVSASEFNGYSSTFGFVHFMGMGRDGEAYGAEYPILMHDQRLLALDSDGINQTLRLVEGLYGNHDLWHNLLPVYAGHFILHHPYAPISYGGRLPSYVDFGRRLRTYTEEYEIGVAMAHARTQQERFAEDPDLREQQAGYIFRALDTIQGLRTELQSKCGADEIESIVDYLACRAATRAFNVFPPSDSIHEEIDRRMNALGLPGLQISASEVATLLWKQRLISLEAAAPLLESRSLTHDEAVEAIGSDPGLAREVLASAIDLAREDRETGAEHIGNALNDWRAVEALTATGIMTLTGTQKARWLAIMGPQREQLRGHMEKVHGKSSYKLGNEEIAEPRDLALLQYESIAKDKDHYSYRLQARAESQRLGYLMYSLVFDDGQDLVRTERNTFSLFRQGELDSGVQDGTLAAVEALDLLMHRLVTADYSDADPQLRALDTYAAQLLNIYPESTLASRIGEITMRYRNLEQAELNYQAEIGTTYIGAAKRLEEEQMTIS
jgi:adenylate kinase family enzyme